ncbi:hypothetical protein KAFR_0J02710 [Kazachstania africana CBS 2517]|uniref:Uncharacterized protein n=1 Tax=Kazachstania africana (strain ATCC 22294 / BCRC 22015 / CBS 2517 / CECT 1963 / NBRC 1671 / NRRL Y-8276) TaxID=1071382 RepID=H2B135_KAZAF|nr:hypothetical protein KAFR_0J02710 [Kazachstania africana CBS 2517]CCF60335.1 hypothetical protein KAFR_0J02710 [Kazachstania africana CBS 2517]
MQQQNGEVKKLFEEKSITEIKDYLLDVNRELVQVDENFTAKLKLHYPDILQVTEDVAGLYGLLKDVDTEFRDLCFNDDKYQIKKLPEFASDHSSKQVNTNVSLSDHTRTSTESILAISNWLLSISNFFNMASLKSFDDMMVNFQNLRNCHIPTDFQDLINSKIISFQEELFQSLQSSKIHFTLTQRIKLFNLFQDSKSYNWNAQLCSDYQQLLYATIFNEYNDIESNLFESTDPLVREFIHLPDFNTKLIEKIRNDIDLKLNQLEKIIQGELAEQPGETDDSDIGTTIHTAKLNSMGLVNWKDITVYKIIQPIIPMILKLQKFGCDASIINEIKTKLTEIIKHDLNDLEVSMKKISVVPPKADALPSSDISVPGIEPTVEPTEEQPDRDTIPTEEQSEEDITATEDKSHPQPQPVSMNELVDSIVQNYNKTNLIHLLHEQIASLAEINASPAR